MSYSMCMLDSFLPGFTECSIVCVCLTVFFSHPLLFSLCIATVVIRASMVRSLWACVVRSLWACVVRSLWACVVGSLWASIVRTLQASIA